MNARAIQNARKTMPSMHVLSRNFYTKRLKDGEVGVVLTYTRGSGAPFSGKADAVVLINMVFV